MTQITKYSSVKGSLQSIANKAGITVAQAFVNCEVVVLLDVSASMNTEDDCLTSVNTPSRYKKACNQLAKLQTENPGKVCLICFDDKQTFEPSGIARRPGNSTDIAGALSFVHKADNTGLKFIVISDGEPDDDEAAIAMAQQFRSKIHTIYIGPEGGYGADFLKRLSAATGGLFSNSGTAGIGQLSQTVQNLLTA